MRSLSTSFFFVPNENNSFSVGNLLVAEPFMRDKWFERSVIAIFDHSENGGTTGVVLNNELTTTLSEVFKDVETNDIPVFCGGPLGHDRLFFLHTLGEQIIPDAKEIFPGLWMGGRFSSALEYVNSGYPHEGSIRFFIGYSGWSPGQLSQELKEHTWAIPENKFDASTLLTGEGNSYWHKIVKQMGAKYRPWQVLPQDSRAN